LVVHLAIPDDNGVFIESNAVVTDTSVGVDVPNEVDVSVGGLDEGPGGVELVSGEALGCLVGLVEFFSPLCPSLGLGVVR